MFSFYKTLYLIGIAVTLQITQLHSQLCLNSNITLLSNGTYILTEDDVLSLELQPEYTVLINPSVLTCANIGFTSVDVRVTFEGDTVYSCTSIIGVSESVPPVALCKNSLHVVLDGFGDHVFSLEELNNGSYDDCTAISYEITPPSIGCGDDNPSNITLIVEDATGNSSSCTITVFYEDTSNPADDVICKSAFEPGIALGQEIVVTSDMLLDGGPYSCYTNYHVEISENGNIRPLPIITYGDVNKNLQFKVTNLSNSNSCSFESVIEEVAGCEYVLTICDTKCNGEPFGDCNSGHTDTDDVEWPCDVFLGHCQQLSVYPTPDVVLELTNDTANAMPNLGECALLYVSVSYTDLVFEIPGGQRIARTWFLYHLGTSQIFNYVQNIYLGYENTQICDVLPWNTPLGDCNSGHTDNDHVEWPADITIYSPFHHPDDLKFQAQINEYDVKPRVSGVCNKTEITFSDVITEADDTTTLILRTWRVKDVFSGETWDYLQQITSIRNYAGSLVCVTRENGEPVPDVELIPGVFTDLSGCHLFTEPSGVVVTPIKDSPLPDGVNLLDKVLLRAHILGIIKLSKYQQYAADISQNFALSTLDFVMMDKVIDGTLDPVFPHNWKFFERNSDNQSIDISDSTKGYKFIAIKMGDIDNSYQHPITILDPVRLSVRDEILNNGETYYIPFYPTISEDLGGFSVSLTNEDHNIEFQEVFAFGLPGFFQSSEFIQDGSVRIEYLADPDTSARVKLTPEEPLFILKIKAKDNLILNEEIGLSVTFDNLLLPLSSDPLKVELDWEGLIISSTTSLSNGTQLVFYPNPVSDALYIRGLPETSKGRMVIINSVGQAVQVNKLQDKLDLQNLETGMYYIITEIEGEELITTPVFRL